MSAQALLDQDLAYCAGLFDGEGSIVITTRSRGYLALDVVLVNTDEACVDHFRSVVGGGGTKGTRSRAGSLGKKTLYFVQWTATSAARVLTLLKPYLRIKRKQAETALKFQGTFDRKHCGAGIPEKVLNRRQDLRVELRETRA